MQISHRVGNGMGHFQLLRRGSLAGALCPFPRPGAVMQGLVQPVDEDEVSVIQNECLRQMSRGAAMDLDDVAVIEVGQHGCFVDQVLSPDNELVSVRSEVGTQALHGECVATDGDGRCHFPTSQGTPAVELRAPDIGVEKSTARADDLENVAEAPPSEMTLNCKVRHDSLWDGIELLPTQYRALRLKALLEVFVSVQSHFQGKGDCRGGRGAT
mmetsp:Transcript_58059/g.123136  ORF Transcript_58059/g.123136 Transcript_58059/m.123136 type:complete len:213 (+) Transcript_58059:151-789(+)